MRDGLKYTAWIAVCLTIAYICVTLDRCDPAGGDPGRVVTAPDSGYLPVTVHGYTPPSTPFENPRKPVTKLPAGTKEKDISRVIIIRTQSGKEPITIIERKDGAVLIPQTDDSLNVSMTQYNSPLFDFSIKPSVGLTYGTTQHVQPGLSVSFFSKKGIYSIPLIVDLSGAGFGFSWKAYHDVAVTPAVMWNYSDSQRSIKLYVSFEL